MMRVAYQRIFFIQNAAYDCLNSNFSLAILNEQKTFNTHANWGSNFKEPSYLSTDDKNASYARWLPNGSNGGILRTTGICGIGHC